MALAKDSKANYIPLATIYGNRNKDGSYTLSALDIKNLNDNLYAIAKKIQGGLTFSDLTSEAGSEISDMSGNVSTLQQTSEAITAEVTSLAARNTVTINANGMFVTNAAGQTTQLSGDHIKSGTIEGVTLISDNGEAATTIGDGEIRLSVPSVLSAKYATRSIVPASFHSLPVLFFPLKADMIRLGAMPVASAASRTVSYSPSSLPVLRSNC